MSQPVSAETKIAGSEFCVARMLDLRRELQHTQMALRVMHEHPEGRRMWGFKVIQDRLFKERDRLEDAIETQETMFALFNGLDRP